MKQNYINQFPQINHDAGCLRMETHMLVLKSLSMAALPDFFFGLQTGTIRILQLEVNV